MPTKWRLGLYRDHRLCDVTVTLCILYTGTDVIADADWLLHVSYRAISKAIKYSVTKYLIALPLVVCSASGTLSRGCRNCRPTHGPTRVLDVRITLRIRTTELYG